MKKVLPMQIILALVVLAAGVVWAAPVLDRVDTDLRGALIPGSMITFTAEGSPGAKAILTLRMTLGGGSPIDWTATMQEDSSGHYLYQWELWQTDNLIVASARIDLKDPRDGTTVTKNVPGFPASLGGEIRGTVIDDLTRLPIAGVQLMAHSATTGHYAVVYSNARGEYTLQGLGAAKDYRVWTRNELGYTDAKRDAIQVQSGSTTGRIDLALSGLAAVTGVVEDELGNPVPGATVAAVSLDGQFRQTTNTDRQGRYTLPGLQIGGYDLIARYDDVQAATVLAVQAAKKSSASFRLRLAKEKLLSYPVTIPDAADGDQLLYWPSQGGRVQSTAVSDGQAVLSEVTAGEELVLDLQSTFNSTMIYRLIPANGGEPNLTRIAPSDDSAVGVPLLTMAAPLSSRGGAAQLYGQAEGIDWVDLWIDGLWMARLPVKDQQWQTTVHLNTGSHEVMAMAVGTDLAPARQQVEIDRQRPTIGQISLNQQPVAHFYSGGSTGNLLARPKQPLQFTMTASEVGWSNWLVLGEQQWLMARSDQRLNVTIPAEVMVAGRYPLIWRWEKQGKRGEMVLGTLIVRQPTTYTFIDAFTSEPVPGVSVQLEQWQDNQWQPISDGRSLSDASGRLNLWLPTEGSFRLWVSAAGYRGETVQLNHDGRDRVVVLDPTRVPGPIFFSPERDARGVSRSTPIIIAFDRDLDPRSVTPDRFYIQGVPGNITYDPFNRKLTLTPSTNLAADGYYLVHLSGAIKTIDGVPLGKSQWWLISTAADSSTEDRSTARKLLTANQAGKLATRDGYLSATIPAGTSPVQTLYKLERSELPTPLPKGWSPVAPVVGFSAIYSPLDRPLAQLRQGVELTINYTEPPAEGQSTALWRYDAASRVWEQVDCEHNAYLRSVRFATTRPGIYLFAKQQTT